MENLLLFLATSLVLRAANPRFKRYVICPGSSALLNSGAKTLEIRYTKEGDKIYFNEYEENDVTYGMICVQMQEVYTLSKAENILVQYINRVRKPLQVTVNFSMELERTKSQLSITDYWQDESGTDWKIKGYTNGKIVSVMYVKNIGNTSVTNHDAYLNSFKFSFAQ